MFGWMDGIERSSWFDGGATTRKAFAWSLNQPTHQLSKQPSHRATHQIAVFWNKIDDQSLGWKREKRQSETAEGANNASCNPPSTQGIPNTLLTQATSPSMMKMRMIITMVAPFCEWDQTWKKETTFLGTRSPGAWPEYSGQHHGHHASLHGMTWRAFHGRTKHRVKTTNQPRNQRTTSCLVPWFSMFHLTFGTQLWLANDCLSSLVV